MGLLLVGFSGDSLSVVLAIVVASVLAAWLSYLETNHCGRMPWLWGLAVLTLPVVFVLCSSEPTPEETLEFRLRWLGCMSIIYVCSVIGGYSAKRSDQKRE